MRSQVVASRAALQDSGDADATADLRGCIRDLVALSSLPAIWIKASAREVVDGLAQLIVSVLDVDFACAVLTEPAVEVVHCHHRAEGIERPAVTRLLAAIRPNCVIDLESGGHERMRAMRLPIGRERGGALLALSRRPTFPLETEQMLLRVAANQAAIAIQRWRSEQRLVRQTQVLHRLNEIGAAIAGNLETEAVIQTVTDAATELSGAQFGAFFYNVVAEDGEKYMLYTLSGASREAFSSFPLPRNSAVFEPTFRGAGVVRSANIRKDPRSGSNLPYNGMPPGHLPVTSYLAVPVRARSGEVAGGLFFGHADEGVFTDEAELIVSGIAAQASVALDNARLYEAARSEIARREKVEAHQNLLLAELSHRVKNTLAIVQSIATHTVRHAPSPQHFEQQFIARLSALSKVHNLLTETSWSGVALAKLLEQVLGAFASGQRCTMRGDEVIIRPQDAVSAVLVLHELATNCAKYGALSSPGGQVDVSWSRAASSHGGLVVVRWAESGGPQVKPPARAGFGSLLITRALTAQPEHGRLDYRPSGLVCTFALRCEQAGEPPRVQAGRAVDSGSRPSRDISSA